MRRATIHWQGDNLYLHISIHALHEESDLVVFDGFDAGDISIHALHEESDVELQILVSLIDQFQSTLSMRRAPYSGMSPDTQRCLFQSTLSMRRATVCAPVEFRHVHISIHALHEESDEAGTYVFEADIQFQSTLSMRRATSGFDGFEQPAGISIHALHEESDHK